MEPWTSEWKLARLAELFDKWVDCTRCPLSKTRKNVVFGHGNPMADLLFVGEAPGDDEDKSGIPFEGRSGELFNALLTLAKINRDDVYVTNILGCRPPENRDPNKAERDACVARLHEIIYIVDPILIVPVGKVPLKALAKGRDWPITEYRGQLFSSPNPRHRVSGDSNGAEIPGRFFPKKGDGKDVFLLEYDMIPIVHPAAILRTDSYDDKQKRFAPGGWADKTIDDLRYISRFVSQLKEEYRRVPR